MRTGAVATHIIREEALPRFGGGGTSSTAGSISNGRIAVVMLMAAETMLFTTLIGGYIVLRGTSESWPPPGQPRLPLAVTWVNTFVLFVSCWTMARSWRASKTRDLAALNQSLFQTALLGSTFLAVQGFEWGRLVRHGLTTSTSLYGATFYTLIGLHGLHVAAAAAWLVFLSVRVRRGNLFALNCSAGVDLCALYWFYVCGLWAILFPLVYLY
jgi:heme/copper-type cytochrome/quinol oxidase subunit 3